MQQAKEVLCRLILLASLFLVCPATFVGAAETCEQWVAKVASVQGVVQVRRAGETEWLPVNFDDTYCPGDIIRVLESSRAAVVLPNEATLRLDQNTTITFAKPEKEQTLLLKLLSGAAHFLSRIPRTLKVATPFVNGTVEGTEFLVRVERELTFLSVFEGKVATSNEAGSLLLARGQSAVAKRGEAPVLQIVIHPRDAVQWALYYPTVIYGKVREDTNDPRYLAYRAQELLAVGRVEEANANIERALKLEPNNSDALSMQAIIAVVLNEKEKALSSAEQAVKANPNSATPLIALSYAQQASFNLKGVRTSLEKAVQVEPGNGLAWAKLSEIQASFGALDKSLEAAQKAESLDPNLSRTQTVLGFAYLREIKLDKSKEAFEKAIKFDQADPLPRLGLGLAKIRDGNLDGGGRDIEIAAALDPNNSLIRSYLGKAFFDEKRTKLDGPQFAIAKELDPQDPTPWFYDAIRKLTINRPVDALHDLQKSIELNNNRAVYRSRLLLDQDLAARSASLARIYSTLGFDQLALVEGWKSVNTDPGNYSAHRFLADSYAVLPRHQVARVSELLQSQLLQPLNITPVQPSLAASDLFILESAGPSDPSFNEFNPLFLRNRFALQASGTVGEHDTLGDELVQSAVWGRLSYSLGQFYYDTDGFRDNNDLKQKLYNAFTQVSLSYKTSVQAEYRYSDKESGDLPLRFDPDNFFPTERQDEKTKSLRLGFRQAFSPHSDLIASFIYQDAQFDTVDTDPFFPFELSTDEDGYMGEIRHLFSMDRFHLSSGFGYFKAHREDKSTFPPSPADKSDTNIRHTNFYFYSLVNYPDPVSWTLGASADFLHGAIDDRDQFNPKLGFIWNPFPDTTLRAAVFRTLQRPLISSQTLEPTQVAGFNQFFEDAEAVEAWCYGIALDQRLFSDLFGGAEYRRRDLTVPYEEFAPPPANPEVKNAHWHEYTARAYLYWTPYRMVALSAEYQYEKLKRDEDFVGPELFLEVKTHRVPLAINFFHPTGFSAQLQATYVEQKGDFGDPLGAGVEQGKDDFWVVDGSLSYRLPKRLGLISLEARNLFNEKLNFQDTDPSHPRIYPERFIFARFTFAL